MIKAKFINAMAALLIASAMVFTGCSNGSSNDLGGDGAGDEIVLDFTSLGGKTITAAYDFATYDSVSGENKGSITSEGLVLDVDEAWDGAFKIATNPIDMSGVKKIELEYKLSSGWTWKDEQNNKINVMLVSEENSSYKAVKVDLADFAEGASNTTFTKDESTNIYPKTWDGCSGADKTKIIAIKVNTMSGSGSVTIKSIKFYK